MDSLSDDIESILYIGREVSGELEYLTHAPRSDIAHTHSIQNPTTEGQ
jgi:hypothetical protein